MLDTIKRLNEQLIPENALPDDNATEEQKQEFIIDTTDKANWASLRLKEQAEQIEAIEAWRERRIARINEIADKEINRIEPRMNFLTWKLREYLHTLFNAGRKTKTLDLEGGTFRLTKRQPIITYDDNILEWAQENAQQFIKNKPTLDRTAFRKSLQLAEGGALVTEDGEIVPGTWEHQPDAATFKPHADE